MEAADALDPEGLAWMQEGADDMRERARRLSVTLWRRIMRDRADLTFAGQDIDLGLGAPPVVVPRDLLDDDTSPEGAFFVLNFCDQSLALRFKSPARSFTLLAVRVVRAGGSALTVRSGSSNKARGPSPGSMQKGGRVVDRAVADAIGALGAKLAADGLPEARRGGQASLERWFVAEVERRGGKLSESRVRAHVRRALEEHRAALDR
jgi:hypothetical protein